MQSHNPSNCNNNRELTAAKASTSQQQKIYLHNVIPDFPLSLFQCWGSERFYSDLDSDSAPVFQTRSDSDSAPFGSGSESEYIRIRILVKIYLMRLSQFKLSPIKKILMLIKVSIIGTEISA